MIEFICDVLGYEMQYTNNYNFDQYVIFGSIMCVFVLFILSVYFLTRFLQWIWGAIK